MIYEAVLRDLISNWMPRLYDCAPGRVIDISGLSLQLLGEAVDYCSFCGGAVFSSDPFHEPPEYFDTGISSCIVKDGHVEGMLLVRREDGPTLAPVLLFSNADDLRESIRELIAFTLESASESYPPDTTVVISQPDDRIKDRLDYYFGRNESNRIASFFSIKQTDL